MAKETDKIAGKWTVNVNKRVAKQKLPQFVRLILTALIREIEIVGPLRSNWHNYGKLSGSASTYHCHLKKGNPTYVAVWTVIDKKVKIVEVIYAGTHEKAPY